MPTNAPPIGTKLRVIRTAHSRVTAYRFPGWATAIGDVVEVAEHSRTPDHFFKATDGLWYSTYLCSPYSAIRRS